MKVVVVQGMVSKFGYLLAELPLNILNSRTVPWMDIGDLPLTYIAVRAEAWQMFKPPNNKPPVHMIVNYSEWARKYDFERAKMNYPKFVFEYEGIALTDIPKLHF